MKVNALYLAKKILRLKRNAWIGRNFTLKESKSIKLDTTIFKWKYPLWNSKNIVAKDSIWETMVRSGIRYAD